MDYYRIMRFKVVLPHGFWSIAPLRNAQINCIYTHSLLLLVSGRNCTETERKLAKFLKATYIENMKPFDQLSEVNLDTAATVCGL